MATDKRTLCQNLEDGKTLADPETEKFNVVRTEIKTNKPAPTQHQQQHNS